MSSILVTRGTSGGIRHSEALCNRKSARVCRGACEYKVDGAVKKIVNDPENVKGMRLNVKT